MFPCEMAAYIARFWPEARKYGRLSCDRQPLRLDRRALRPGSLKPEWPSLGLKQYDFCTFRIIILGLCLAAMNLQDIEAFVAVAEAGSVNRAALRLNLTQPATTRRVQNFEAAIGHAP